MSDPLDYCHASGCRSVIWPHQETQAGHCAKCGRWLCVACVQGKPALELRCGGCESQEMKVAIFRAAREIEYLKNRRDTR